MSAVSKTALQDLLCQNLEVQRHTGPHETTRGSYLLLNFTHFSGTGNDYRWDAFCSAVQDS